MTSAGLDRLFAFIEGAWPHAEIPDTMIHAWRLKLDRFEDDRAMQAVFDLSETERFLPALSQVYQRCVEVGRNEIMRQPVQRELTSGDDDPLPTPNRAVPHGARGWCQKCQSALLGYDPPGELCRNCDPSYLRSYAKGTR